MCIYYMYKLLPLCRFHHSVWSLLHSWVKYAHGHATNKVGHQLLVQLFLRLNDISIWPNVINIEKFHKFEQTQLACTVCPASAPSWTLIVSDVPLKCFSTALDITCTVLNRSETSAGSRSANRFAFRLVDTKTCGKS